MEQEKKSAGDILSTLTIAVFFMVIILLVVFSAAAYRKGTDARDANDNYRAVLSYVASAVKDNQEAEIEIKKMGDSKGIAIKDNNGYERRIFAKGGKLLEEFVIEGGSISDDDAFVIGNVKLFEASYIGNDILKIRTDLGTSYVRMKKSR